jgi:hypothetical protein
VEQPIPLAVMHLDPLLPEAGHSLFLNAEGRMKNVEVLRRLKTQADELSPPVAGERPRAPKLPRQSDGMSARGERSPSQAGAERHDLKVAVPGAGINCRLPAGTAEALDGRAVRLSQGSTYTGIPTQTSLIRYSAFQLARRKQPCDSVRPTCSGLGVLWMP